VDSAEASATKSRSAGAVPGVQHTEDGSHASGYILAFNLFRATNCSILISHNGSGLSDERKSIVDDGEQASAASAYPYTNVSAFSVVIERRPELFHTDGTGWRTLGESAALWQFADNIGRLEGQSKPVALVASSQSSPFRSFACLGWGFQLFCHDGTHVFSATSWVRSAQALF
jgi:hypothetical protein